MTNVQKILMGSGVAVLMGGGVAVLVNQPNPPPPVNPSVVGTAPPSDICTGNYWYMRSCDTFWAAAWTGGGFPVADGPGHESAGCSAHTKVIVGDDWKSYAIIDQGPGAQGYRKPSDNGVAAAKWIECFQGPGLPTYDCATVTPPPGTQVYAMRPLSFVQPAGQRAAYATMFGCSGPTPSPVPTVAPVPTPSGSHPMADWIEQLTAEGIAAGCGANRYCPDQGVTRAQLAVFLLKTKHGSNYVPPPCVGVFFDVPCVPSQAVAPQPSLYEDINYIIRDADSSMPSPIAPVDYISPTAKRLDGLFERTSRRGWVVCIQVSVDGTAWKNYLCENEETGEVKRWDGNTLTLPVVRPLRDVVGTERCNPCPPARPLRGVAFVEPS